MELIWTAHKGEHLLVTGYVHPPTERRHVKALEMLGEKNIVTIKGLEGGTDIPISRPTKAIHKQNDHEKPLILDPRQYAFHGHDIRWEGIDTWRSQSMNALNGEGAFLKAVVWNAGIYLWLAKISDTIADGIKKAEISLTSGSAKATLQHLIKWRKEID